MCVFVNAWLLSFVKVSVKTPQVAVKIDINKTHNIVYYTLHGTLACTLIKLA